MFAKHRAASRSSDATPADCLQTAEKPPGLIIQSHLFVELRQGLLPLHHIAAHAELELAQAHRTKVQRASVTFLQVIRPIHQTTEIDTNRYSVPARTCGRFRASTPSCSGAEPASDNPFPSLSEKG